MSKTNNSYENGVEVVMKNAKILSSQGVKKSAKGTSYIQFKAIALSDPNDSGKGEVKLTATAFGKIADLIGASPKSLFTLKGALRPNSWEKDGQTIVSNQFIVNIAEPSKAAPTAVAEEIEDDDIPF